MIKLCSNSKNLIDNYKEKNKSKEIDSDDDIPELEETNSENISKKLSENNLLDEKIKNIIRNQKIGVIKLIDINDINDNKLKKKTNPKKKNPYYKLGDKKYCVDLDILNNLLKPLKKLDKMIGMESVKESIVDINKIVDYLYKRTA